MTLNTQSDEEEDVTYQANPLVGKSREQIEEVGRALRQYCIPDPAAFRTDCLTVETKRRAAPLQLRPMAKPITVAIEHRTSLHTEPAACTCCGESTPLRLKGVPLCSPCLVNLVNARGRELVKASTASLLPFPIEGSKCGKRGSRPARQKKAA